MHKRLILLLLAPLLLAPLLGGLYTLVQTGDLESTAYRDLESVARLKSEQIESWLDERSGDSRMLQNSHELSLDVARFLDGRRGAASAEPLRDRLGAIRASYGYLGAHLFDRDAHLVLQTGDDPNVAPELAAAIAKAVASSAVVRTDLYREAEGDIHLDWVVPVLAGQPASGRVLGAVVLRSEPNTYLFPMVHSWPTVSDTAEGLLLRKDGDQVVYLSGQPHRNATPYSLRLPLVGGRFGFARALGSAPTGALRAVDERGVDTLAAYHSIRNTSWRFVARVDRAEVLRPMWRAVRWIVAIALAALLSIALVLWRLLRQQQHLSRLEADATRAQADQQLQSLGNNLPNGFVYRFEVTPTGLRSFTYISAGIARTNGLSADAVRANADLLFRQLEPDNVADYERIRNLSARDLSPFRAVMAFRVSERRTVSLQVQSQPHRRPDGTTVWDGVAIDVTERQAQQVRAERLRLIYANLSRVSDAILRAADEDELLSLVCRIPVESGLMAMAWIAVASPAGEHLIPRYRFGKNTEYLDGILISTSVDVAEGRGATGTAWRTGKPVVSDDIANNPMMTPWAERAAKYGWNSVASFPILRGQRIFAVLTVYNEEFGVFDEEVLPLLNTMAADVAFGLDSLDAERNLIESKARISALIGAIPDLIIVNSADGTYLDAHPPAAPVLYKPLPQLIGKRIDDVLPAPIGSDFAAAFARALASREVQELTYALVLDGITHHFEARVMPSDARTLITIIRDITANTLAERELETYRQHLEELVRERTDALTAALQRVRFSEEALKRTNHEQQVIFESASMGIVFTRNRTVVRCNRRFEELLGYGPGELIGLPSRIWYAEDGAFEAVEGLTDPPLPSDGGGEARYEVEARRKDGSTFLAGVIGRYIGPQHASEGIVAVVDDITMLRRAEAATRRAKELAEEATQMKSDFLANMSHEIRTPMNVIIGMSHLMRSTELTRRQQDFMEKIQMSGEHLLTIINDVLDFSKIEAGKLAVEAIEFDLERVLDKAVTLVQERAAAKGLELLLDIDPLTPDFLLGDPTRLGQILINYANNAVKFTERGEVVLQLRVRDTTDDEIVLYFAVRDTGIGLAPDRREAVFESFQQADRSTTRKHGGTGLGLAISKSLAKAMGGEVGVESELGSGSTFWFTARFGRSPRRKRELVPRPDLRGRRVLVVDDNPAACEVLAAQLRRLGFDTAEVGSGDAAIQEVHRAAAAHAPYDIVFLDWRMPALDGVETARLLRAADAATPLRIVMVTAFDRELLLRQVSGVGIGEVLAKPVTPSTVYEAAVRVLSDQEAPPTPTPSLDPSDRFRRLRDRCVLLVEDNELNREVATQLLAAVGVRVDTATDGQAALERIAQRTYDAVLMDMQMPVMDGLAATRVIREDPRHASLPILAMTANAMQGDREQCLAAGMNDHIPKPIDPEELWRKLGDAIFGAADPEYSQRVRAPVRVSPPGIASGLLAGPIEGLDADLGVRRVGGSHAVYGAVLRKFAETYRGAAAQIAGAIADGELKLAERLAHSLKGVGATIGADPLKLDAGALEGLLRTGGDPHRVEAALTQLASSLGGLILGLDRRLPPPLSGDTPTATVVDRALLQTVLSGLADLLADGRFEAGALLERHRVVLQAGLGERYAPLAAAMQAFDFECASRLLGEARAALGLV